MSGLPYLFSETEAAKQLGISVNTLRGIRQRGEIRCRRVGKRARYTLEDLERYLEGEWTDSRSETTGSQSDPGASSGAERGSVVRLDRHAAAALARQTFGKPSSGSPNGSQ